MREHVAQHILFALHGIQEAQDIMKTEVGIFPCGFCGREDTCTTHLLCKKNGKPYIATNCPYHYEGMRYVDPMGGNSANPKCKNTPIYCTLCPASSNGHPRTIWKYTAHLHLVSQH
ncbi:hypothetical protein C8Q72DRAFT_902661, partial [Fomitopsis betulina]